MLQLWYSNKNTLLPTGSIALVTEVLHDLDYMIIIGVMPLKSALDDSCLRSEGARTVGGVWRHQRAHVGP